MGRLNVHLNRSSSLSIGEYFHIIEVVYVITGNQAFCFALHLAGVHFQGELQHVGHMNDQKNNGRPIKTHEIIISNCYIKTK